MCNMYVCLGLNRGIEPHNQNTQLNSVSQNVGISEDYIMYELIFSTNPIASGVLCK
jgi:hypothetical protein